MRKEYFKTFYENEFEVGDIDPGIWMSNYIVDRMELNDEQILWFCFLFSITYQLPTAYVIINEFPDLENLGIERLNDWWDENQAKMPFQTDKLKQRKFLPQTVQSYKELIEEFGSQKNFFDKLFSDDPHSNFDILWDSTYKSIVQFGRFSVWNWAQSLKQIAGYKISPSTLFLGESNAKSHTHGLCLAYGKDNWAVKEKVDGKSKYYKFSDEDKSFLNNETSELKKLINENIVDDFMIETVACAFKKLFRDRDSRYIGYYLDRQSEDITKTSEHWKGVDWKVLWDARKELLQKEYLNLKVNKSKFKQSLSEKIVKLPKRKEDIWF